MGLGLRVRYRSMDGAVYGEQVVMQLPVRIGRNALNDCIIQHPYVSEFHAVVELIDGQLGVRDLNSKNGVYLASSGRLETGRFLALSSSGNVFALGPNVHVQVETFEQNAQAGARMSPVQGSVLGRESGLPESNEWPRGGLPAAPLPLGSPSLDPSHGVASLPPLSLDDRAAPYRPPPVQAVPRGGVQSPLSHGHSLPPLPALSPAHDPGAAGGPSPYSPLAGTTGKPHGANRGTQHFAMGTQDLALVGLRELAASLVPGAEMQTTGDVARLLTKLHDTIEVFCRCFVPLRAAYEQFVSSMYLQRAASQRSLNRSESAMRVEVARDPASVAAALLDWRNQEYDAPKVVEGVLADVATHYVSLVEGVMRGVQALLDELSPENIERQVSAKGSPIVPGRQRALWQAFKERHDELTSESRSFELVFGAEFAASYREFLERERKAQP
jgi:type VI secretion system protein ImpI